MVKAYEAGRSVSAICRIVGCTENRLYRLLRERGVPLRLHAVRDAIRDTLIEAHQRGRWVPTDEVRIATGASVASVNRIRAELIAAGELWRRREYGVGA
jgi:transposase-like protein